MRVKFIIITCDGLDTSNKLVSAQIEHYCRQLCDDDAFTPKGAEIVKRFISGPAASHEVALEEKTRSIDLVSAGQQHLLSVAQMLLEEPPVAHNFVIALSHYGCDHMAFLEQASTLSKNQVQVQSLTSARNVLLANLEPLKRYYRGNVEVRAAALKKYEDKTVLIHRLEVLDRMLDAQIRQRYSRSRHSPEA